MSSRRFYLLLPFLTGAALFGQPSAVITSPLPGSTVVLGSTVTFEITVNSVPSSSIKDLVISTGRGAPFRTFTSLEADFSSNPIRIPVVIGGLIGQARFGVLLGVLNGGTSQNLSATPIDLLVEPATITQPIRVTEGLSSFAPPSIRMSYRGQTQDLTVWDSSSPPNLLSESRLLSVASDNPSVAVVAATRPLTIVATGAGTTQIRIGSVPIDVQVCISSRTGDLNNDGKININDVSLLPVSSIDVIASQPADDRDLNHDGVINGADETALRALCDHPNCTLQAPLTKVQPIVECVATDSKGNKVAYFGYDNQNDDGANIAVGTKNQFSPSPEDRGQPTDFFVGRQDYVFSVPLTGSLTWTLVGPDKSTNTATASAASPTCPSDVTVKRPTRQALPRRAITPPPRQRPLPPRVPAAQPPVE